MLAVALACRPPAPEPLSPRLQVRARLLRIEDTRRNEPAFLDSLLRGADAGERAAAALTVGRIGARAHLAALRRLAPDPDSTTAANALFSLGLLKDTASASAAVDALDKPTVGVEGAWLLGEIGDAKAITVALTSAATPPATRAALLLAASRLRPVPAAAIVPFLAHADSAIAWRAAYALARGRSAPGARALLAQAGSPWASVRDQVARGAVRGMAGDSLAPLAHAALTTLVADTSAYVRISAIRSLASYGPAGRDDIVNALRDANVGVKLVAAQSLDAVQDSSVAAWTLAFDAETTFAVQRAVADGAIKRGINVSERAQWRGSPDWQRRLAAAELDAPLPARNGRSLGQLQTPPGGQTAAVARVLFWLDDPDGRVRASAVGALAQFAESEGVRSTVRERLRTALTDSDIGVRAASLGALRRGASLDDLAAGLRAYERALGDVDSDARLAFWALADSALARAPAALPDSLERQLRTLARPGDVLERMAASRVKRFAEWRDSTGTARDLAWYEERARESARPMPLLQIVTERGTFELRLFVAEAPLTVHNMVSLAKQGYFDGQRFHRVVPNFVVQGGDPRGDGTGGPGYAIRDEINRRRYLRGTLGMALSGPNTGGSQFFVTHSPQPHLDGGYTVFGELVRGWDVLDRIVQGDRIVRVMAP